MTITTTTEVAAYAAAVRKALEDRSETSASTVVPGARGVRRDRRHAALRPSGEPFSTFAGRRRGRGAVARLSPCYRGRFGARRLGSAPVDNDRGAGAAAGRPVGHQGRRPVRACCVGGSLPEPDRSSGFLEGPRRLRHRARRRRIVAGRCSADVVRTRLPPDCSKRRGSLPTPSRHRSAAGRGLQNRAAR